MRTQRPTVARGYGRVSTGLQARGGGSLEDQRARILAYCQSQGWQLAEVIDDGGQSGSIPFASRPGGRQLLAQLRPGDVLVALDASRLHRSVRDHLALVEAAKVGGWRVATVKGDVPDASTPTGEFQGTVLAAVNQLHRQLTNARTKECLRTLQAKGMVLGRPPVMDDGTRRLVLELSRRHRSWSKVARLLNRRGVKTARGARTWYPATVRKVVLAAERPVQPIRPTRLAHPVRLASQP